MSFVTLGLFIIGIHPEWDDIKYLLPQGAMDLFITYLGFLCWATDISLSQFMNAISIGARELAIQFGSTTFTLFFGALFIIPQILFLYGIIRILIKIGVKKNAHP